MIFIFLASADFDCVVARGCVNIETTNSFSFWILKYQQQLNNMDNVIGSHFVVDLLLRDKEFLFTM